MSDDGKIHTLFGSVDDDFTSGSLSHIPSKEMRVGSNAWWGKKMSEEGTETMLKGLEGEASAGLGILLLGLLLWFWLSPTPPTPIPVYTPPIQHVKPYKSHKYHKHKHHHIHRYKMVKAEASNIQDTGQ